MVTVVMTVDSQMFRCQWSSDVQIMDEGNSSLVVLCNWSPMLIKQCMDDSLIHLQPEATYWKLTDWPSKVDRAPKSLGKGHLSSEEYHHIVDALHLIQSDVELTGTGLLNIGFHLHVLWMCVCGVCDVCMRRV